MKIEYVPLNDEPATNPDRDYIAGKYSTFDPDLSRQAAVANQTENRSDKVAALNAANKRVNAAKAMALGMYIAERFEQALAQVPELGRMYENFDQLNWDEKVDFAQYLINEAINRIDLVEKNELPKIRVRSGRDVKIAGFRLALGKFPEIMLNPDMHKPEGRSDSKLSPRSDFMATIIHEFQHAIDFVVPRMSALGAQVVNIAREQYQGVVKNAATGEADIALYELNPLEIMAYGWFDKFGGKQ